MISDDLTTPIACTLLLYVVVSYALAWRFSRKIESREDYLVAGRRLPLPLASATLLATWFGAGTLLTAADEVRDVGLRAIALEPLGAALCLLIAGIWVARPLWEMKLETLGDFFRERFGGTVELWASLAMVPGYFGWIAVQLVALAEATEETPFKRGVLAFKKKVERDKALKDDIKAIKTEMEAETLWNEADRLLQRGEERKAMKLLKKINGKKFNGTQTQARVRERFPELNQE